MFDMLTSADLHILHEKLFSGATRIHQRMMYADGTPVIDPLSADWEILAAAHHEITETCRAVYAELARRNREDIHA